MRVNTLDTEGFVYFIEAPHVGRIKIGLSASDPEAEGGRLAQLRQGSPIPLRLIGYIRGPLRMEKDLHKKFAGIRVHYEWFDGHAKLREFIEYHPGLIRPRLASSIDLVSGSATGKVRKGRRRAYLVDDTPPIPVSAIREVDEQESIRKAMILVDAIFGPSR